MKLRKGPMFLSLLVALALLFSGYFLFQKVQIEKPLMEQAEQMTSAKLIDFSMQKDKVTYKFEVTNPEQFVIDYPKLIDAIKTYAPEKAFDIMLTNQDESLQPIWNEGLFGLIEAIETKQYSNIPELLSEWKETYKLDEAFGRIDDKYVYIFMKRGEDEFYKVIPRKQPISEVVNRG
ncbi:hypothetical protein [Brevibacillus daliensis]|uniref:hypothetical protein n=1 Tax=Brevibacillus daliensis TaxID=2892995 RepID=UPI001E42C242|nr:hypothetical protein [Brevibacillus daliensis]